MADKYGFVYIWYDRKHKRYYVGSHWGAENDGYLCSSRWMKAAYKRRPSDFKRRILKKISTNKHDLLEEEFRYLSMIKPAELKIKYYNLRNHKFNHWSTDDKTRLSVAQKTGNTLRESRAKMTAEERKQKFGFWKGKESPTKGKKSSLKNKKNKFVEPERVVNILKKLNKKCVEECLGLKVKI